MTNKHVMVISAPVDTYSGYGARARDIVYALLKQDKYDIKIVSQPWGNTRHGFLEDHNDTEISSRIVSSLSSKPDIWIQITVPNEFTPVGRYNIGITAGVETTIAPASWIEGCNRMNLVITSSTHAKKVFETSKYTGVDRNNRPVQELSLKVPIEVVFEGVDLSKYFPVKVGDPYLEGIVKEDWCFLFVGHWMRGEIGHDRKNVGYLIKSFLETFKNTKKPPALILKTQIGGTSMMDRDRLLTQIDIIKGTVKGKLPNIYLIHGDLSDEEMNVLYNHSKVKAMITLTKGEGFCRPLLEFTATNKPLICSGWSGPLDFLDSKYNILVGGTLEKVHPSVNAPDILLPEAQWFKPDDSQVAKAYKDMVSSYKTYYLSQAKRQGFYSRSNFSLEKMEDLLEKTLDKYLVDLPFKLEVELPKLQLPALKKV